MITIRHKIAVAIMKGIEEDIRPGESRPQDYDPDTIHRCADEVIAVLISELTGQSFKAKFPPGYIGPAIFLSNE